MVNIITITVDIYSVITIFCRLLGSLSFVDMLFMNKLDGNIHKSWPLAIN